MSNSKSKNNNSSKVIDSKENFKNQSKKLISNKSSSSLLEEEILNMSYEESIDSLDSILSKLQQENTPLNDLEEIYDQGRLYLDHCEKLLSNLEQKIITLDTEELKD